MKLSFAVSAVERQNSGQTILASISLQTIRNLYQTRISQWFTMCSHFISPSLVWLFLPMSVRSKYRNCCKTEYPNCKQQIESKILKSVANTAVEILACNLKACVSSLIKQRSNIQAKLISTSLSLPISRRTFQAVTLPPHTSPQMKHHTSCCVRSIGKFSL